MFFRTQSQSDALHLYTEKGIYIRRISNPEDEIKTLAQNQDTLKTAGVKTAEDLKKYFTNVQGQDAKLLPNFRFRPATLIKANLAISDFTNYQPGILLNPNENSVLATHFYKKNVSSGTISQGKYKFDRTSYFRAKNCGSHEKLLKKLKEHESRRVGEAWDNYNRQYGQIKSEHNEILLSYDLNAIVGIVVPEKIEKLSKAVALRKLLKKELKNKGLKKKIPYYYYQADIGLIPLSDKEVSERVSKEDNTGDEQFESVKQALKKLEPPVSKVIFLIPSTFKEIECSLAQEEPSSEHPIQYSFSKPPEIKSGKFFFKAGRPMFEINEKKLYADNNYTPGYIAKEYQHRQMTECNQFLDELNPEFEFTYGVTNLNLHTQNSAKGNHMELNYDHPKNSPPKPEKILKVIGYDPSKWKWEILKTTSNQTKIRLSVFQAIDAMKTEIQALHHSSSRIRSSKRRRMQW